MKHITRTFVLSTALAASLFAQDENELPVYELKDIIVTGQLWDSELQKTTASVSVLDNEQLKSNGSQHFEDVIYSIPNLTWTGGTSRPRYIQIRGIGENSQFEGETPDSTVRFLIDDLDFTGLGTVGNLFDVQQVEVLRGPQAGAFGANAAGGVIKIVSKEPTSYWTGQVEGTIGNDDLVAAGLAFGGPILESDPEQLTFRFSVNSLNQNGFRDNQFLNRDDTNERDELSTRLRVRWSASEDWQWEGTFFYSDVDNGYDEWSLNNTGFDVFSDEPGRDEQESFATSLRGSWTGLDHVEVTTITSFSDTESLYSYDNDWTSGDYDSIPAGTYDGFIENIRERESFSQELRFDSIGQSNALGLIDRWTVGFYFNQLEEETTTDYEDYGGAAHADYEYETDSYSIFGQISHDLSPETRLIIGLRYEYHEVNIETKNVEDSGDWYDGLLFDEDSEQSSSLWGGKITLEHDLSAEQMLFTSFTRGYKAAGANGGIFREATDPLTYDEETIYNSEVGLRSEWWNGTLTSQFTAFYLYRDDPQTRDSAGSGGFFRYFTSNGDEARHCGLEAEATWRINSNLTASAGLGLLKTEDDANDEIANSPSYTFNAQLSYRADNGFFATIEARGSDEYFESNTKENRDQRIRESFVTVNGSVGYQYENWTLTLWAKNLFDEEYQKRIFFFDNFDGQGETRFENPADPQQFGVTANYSW